MWRLLSVASSLQRIHRHASLASSSHHRSPRRRQRSPRPPLRASSVDFCRHRSCAPTPPSPPLPSKTARRDLGNGESHRSKRLRLREIGEKGFEEGRTARFWGFFALRRRRLVSKCEPFGRGLGEGVGGVGRVGLVVGPTADRGAPAGETKPRWKNQTKWHLHASASARFGSIFQTS